MAYFDRAYIVTGNTIAERVPKSAGNVGENIVTSLSFTFSDEWLGASKTIVFKSPKKVLLTPVALVDDSVPVPVDALDSAGKLQFSLQGTFADSAKVIRTPIKELDVSGTLLYTGGTPIATYTNVVSECQDATVDAETATLAANQAAASAMEVANMTVVAETLAAGSPATATLTDDSEAKLLTLGIPQGIQGEQGEQGIQGARGIQGIQGIQGVPGEVTTAQLNAALALKANIAQEVWIAPTLLNGWKEMIASFVPYYYKDSIGIVHVRGKVGTGTLNQAIFTFPVGYRPATTMNFVSSSNNAFGNIYVTITGSVIPNVGATTNVSLDSITFRAEA